MKWYKIFWEDWIEKSYYVQVENSVPGLKINVCALEPAGKIANSF